MDDERNADLAIGDLAIEDLGTGAPSNEDPKTAESATRNPGIEETAAKGKAPKNESKSEHEAERKLDVFLNKTPDLQPLKPILLFLCGAFATTAAESATLHPSAGMIGRLLEAAGGERALNKQESAILEPCCKLCDIFFKVLKVSSCTANSRLYAPHDHFPGDAYGWKTPEGIGPELARYIRKGFKVELRK
ncbi:hypothetical protein LTR09_000848 [Extremus antarcticus]|uniref:Uncharacterized protein n=1 Tax=Extremus antarcticus TaxID=702011 RepID=A0AAJ0LWG4_9PEZI|nr:hypothetical protein LTR09_000848 [Extremus antarcticus]